MELGRIFAVGDIHGYSDSLREVLKAVDFDNGRDTLIALGDLSDRGPDSYGVVEILLGIKNRVLVEGNHDGWIKEFLINNAGKRYIRREGWLMYGGDETIESYKEHGLDYHNCLYDNWQAHTELYNSMVPYHVVDNMCFVHGGLQAHLPVRDQSIDSLAWDRELVNEMMDQDRDDRIVTLDGFDHIFIGHSPTRYWGVDTPITRRGVTNLDTGSGKGGVLTIMNIHTMEYSQSSK